MQVYRELRTQHFQSLDAAPYQPIKNLEDEITKQVPSGDAGKIKDAIRDIYIKAMPERAANLSSTVFAVASLVRRLQKCVVPSLHPACVTHLTCHAWSTAPLNDALNDLRRGSTDEEKRLGEEMSKRMVETMTAQPESNKIITALSNLSYTTMLGLSPSFLVLNLSQPWTVSALFSLHDTDSLLREKS
jgi:hypothetical protein